MSPFVTPAYGRQVYLPNGLNKLSHTLVAIRFQVLDKSRANDRALAMGYCRLIGFCIACLLYTSPSPRDRTRSRMPSSA